MSVYEYPSDKGDLIVTYQVVMPEKLTQEQKESKTYLIINALSSVPHGILYALVIPHF